MKIFNFFKRKPKTWIPNKIINIWERNYWGDSLNWYNYEERKLVGHMTPKPEVDDEIRDKMKSGKICRFRVTVVEHVSGVHDMFWCNVEDVDYL